MLRAFLSAADLQEAGDAMRRFHSLWLSSALKRGVRPPRIPTRRVSDGGWSTLLSTPEGQAWAEEFWQGAFEHQDLA